MDTWCAACAWPRFAPGLVAVFVSLVAGRGGDDVIGDLRIVGLLLALGSGYMLDDGAAVTLQASPFGLARRLGLRLGVALAVITPLWILVLVWRLASLPSSRAAVGLGLTIELAGVLAVVWAVAAWARRGGFDQPGIVTTPVILALLLVAASSSQAPLLVGSGPQWTSAHVRWSLVLAGAAAALLAGMRDPAARWR